MICNSGTAFVARVDGRRLTFEEAGIYNGVFLMKDRETRSMWSHYTGEAVGGPLTGKRLQWVPLERAAWSRVVDVWPNATVPIRSVLKFRPTPPVTNRGKELGNELPDQFVPTLPPGISTKMPLHTHGMGLSVGKTRKFYRLNELYGKTVINDRVSDVPVVVMLQDGSASAAAYSRCVDGKPLHFVSTEHAGQAALRDQQTGSVWTAQGKAVSGDFTGKQLDSVRSMVTDWYGWAAYFQNTEVYESKP